MDKTVTIYCKNTGAYHEYPMGMSLLDICRDLHIELPYPVVAARVNYKVEDLNYPVYKPKDVEFIDPSCPAGRRVYVRTLSMVLAKAVRDLYPQATLHIEHSISRGYYCTLEGLGAPLTAGVVGRVKERVDDIVAQARPIVCEEKQTTEVMKLFARGGEPGREVSLFETLGTPYSRYFRIDDYIDYYMGVLMPSTDCLYLYDFVPLYGGFLMRVPSLGQADRLEPIVPQPKLFEIFDEYVEWNRILKIDNVGQFNALCRARRSSDLIKVAEALHEKKIASIADRIAAAGRQVRFVLVSGPSSSGKTTFSKRLSVQLMANRLRPVPLSLDNYFVDREHTPRDADGNLDFEHFDALDVDFFNRQLRQLLAGGEVELPVFNFAEGRRQFRGDRLRLHEDSILIIEGIHALNPALIRDVPPASVFKVYVSALTTISIDAHNWIPTTDVRLLRRIIRDSRYRNYSAQDTIARWGSVRQGEDRWIFPYQEEADVMFNSALLFELAVLKRHAEPLLLEVPKYCDEYTEAHRLLRFLSYFVSIPDREIPPTSLLREFVGGSSFRY